MNLTKNLRISSFSMLMGGILLLSYCGKGSSASTSPPSISSTEPTEGIAGDPIKVKGANLNEVTSVMFGSISANIVSKSNSELITNVPTVASPGQVTVTISNSAGKSNAIGFEIFKTPEFIDALPPLISKTIPASNYIDYPVLIYGQNLSGVIKLTFGDKEAVIFAQNQSVVTTVVPKNVAAGNVTIKLKTVKGEFSFPFNVLGPPPPNINPGTFSVIIPPPAGYVQTISNDWSCGLFAKKDDSSFVNLSTNIGGDKYTVNGYFKYNYDNARKYNNLNYVEFTNNDTKETWAGMFSSKYVNPCILTMVLVSSKTGRISFCTFDKRKNDPDLKCEHD